MSYHHGLSAFTALDKLGYIRHDILALGPSRLMATMALGLKYRPHVLIVADRLGQAILCPSNAH